MSSKIKTTFQIKVQIEGGSIKRKEIVLLCILNLILIYAVNGWMCVAFGSISQMCVGIITYYLIIIIYLVKAGDDEGSASFIIGI